MSKTARNASRPSQRHQAEALFHIHAGSAKILNLRHIPGDISPDALLAQGIVRVDRATKYGNPFPIGRRFGNRAEVVDRYRRHLWARIRSEEMALEDLAALAGKPLACWCHPKRPCHAEVLARAAAWAAGQLEKSSETP